MNTIFKTSVVLALILALAGCTTYVTQPVAQQGQPQYDYNPGYDPNSVIADAIIASAIVNGVTGYRYGGVFYPQAYYGGVPGYYVGGVFHTSTQYKTTIVNNYNTGRQEFQRNPTVYAQQHPNAVQAKPNYGSNAPANGKPAFGSQQGGMTKGPATATSTPGKPAFGSQQGGMTRSTPTASAPPSKPAFGSSAGTVSRSALSASSTPRSSSSSSGSSRRK